MAVFHRCDRCKGEIGSYDHYLLALQVTKSGEGEYDRDSVKKDQDLCGVCANEYRQIVDNKYTAVKKEVTLPRVGDII